MKWYMRKICRGMLVSYEVDTAKVLSYLANTDWFTIRKSETGEPIPQDVLDKRAEARKVL